MSDKPAMSQYANINDYHKAVIEQQAKRIEELELEIKQAAVHIRVLHGSATAHAQRSACCSVGRMFGLNTRSTR